MKPGFVSRLHQVGNALMRGLLVSPEFNVAMFTFLLHYPWEFLQVPFYESMPEMGHWEAIIFCTRATLGDVLISLGAFWAVALIFRDRNWIRFLCGSAIIIFITVGVAVTVVLEWHAAIVTERWQYDENMPVLPLLGTGISPLLQWIVLPVLTIWLVRRQILGQERINAM